MRPAVWNVVIQRGASFRPVLTLSAAGQPVDLSGCSVLAHGCVDNWEGQEAFTWSSEDQDSYITLGGAAGTISFNVSPVVTAALVRCHGVWCIEVTWGDTSVDRIAEGTFKTSGAD